MGKATAKTARLDVGIWYNERTGHIHIAAAGQFISTVSDDPRSRRYHPNLYGKLAATLRRLGCPGPDGGPEGGEAEPC